MDIYLSSDTTGYIIVIANAKHLKFPYNMWGPYHMSSCKQSCVDSVAQIVGAISSSHGYYMYEMFPRFLHV